MKDKTVLWEVGVVSLATLLLSTAVIAISPALAEEGQEGAQIEADELNYLEKESKVTAKGDVHIEYQERTLKADEVTYNQETGVITAQGTVNLEDKRGNSFYAESAEINDKLTQGRVLHVTGKLGDGALVAANEVIRESATFTVFHDGVYSPCKVCKKKHNGKPLWQISARKVKLDEEENKLTYNHATFDIFGMPVLYTPYLQHYTPASGKKNGFLIPSYSQVSTLGVTVEVPYYINIAPNMDATVTPIFTSQEGNILAGEFRHLLRSGSYELSGSITNPQERDLNGNRVAGHEVRGHIEGMGKFDLGDNWVWGFDGKRSSDDTYLQRYRFGNEDVLTSKAYIENISGRNYLGATALSFQGLLPTDDPDTTPLILPLVNAHYEIDAGYRNSRWLMDGNALVLDRGEGVESRRLSSAVGWNLPFTTQNGQLIEFTTSLRGDVYSVENVVTGAGVKEGSVGRVIPEVRAEWSYPLARSGENHRIFLEPIVDLILSPNGGNPDMIPNEDSQEVEFSDVNLFSNNHFTGLDRVEGGFRTNYGVRGGVTTSLLDTDFLLGQNYRANQDRNFTTESGLDEHFSDYVGRVTVRDNKYTNVSYRFRTDKEDFVMRRNEVSLGLNFDKFGIAASYLSLDEDNDVFDREEAAGRARIRLSEHWSFTANGRRNLEGDGSWISVGAGLVYEDECLRLQSGMKREFLRDRDIEPNTSYLIKISFKNIGRI